MKGFMLHSIRSSRLFALALLTLSSPVFASDDTSDLVRESKEALIQIDLGNLAPLEQQVIFSAIANLEVISQRSQTRYRFFPETSGLIVDGAIEDRLELKGIQRRAEERALHRCNASGAQDCVLLSSVLSQVNVRCSEKPCSKDDISEGRRFTGAKAVARGLGGGASVRADGASDHQRVNDLIQESQSALKSIRLSELNRAEKVALSNVLANLAVLADRHQATAWVFKASSNFGTGVLTPLRLKGLEREAEEAALTQCHAHGAAECVILSSSMDFSNDGDSGYRSQATAHARGLIRAK
jgi:hypothetical protein